MSDSILIDIHLIDPATGKRTITCREYSADWDDALIMGAELWGWDGQRVEKIVECRTGRVICEGEDFVNLTYICEKAV